VKLLPAAMVPGDRDRKKAVKVLSLLRRAAEVSGWARGGGSDRYLPAKEICRSLSLDPEALYKAIASLRGLGYEIEEDAGRGFRLLSSPDIPYPWELAAGLSTRWLGRTAMFFPEVTSTNEIVLQLAREGAPAGLVVVAERQTAGRGRRGREWLSPAQQGLWFSLLLRPALPPEKIPPLALHTAGAVALTIRELYQLNAEVKWPNDVMIGGRKVCGILMEMRADAGGGRHLVIGIGVNVNMAPGELPPEIEATATSLRLELKQPVCRLPLLQNLLVNLERCYDQFADESKHADLMDLARRLSCTLGREVVVRGTDLAPAGFAGQAVAIEADGSLKVEAASGEVRWFHAGDVSVRPER